MQYMQGLEIQDEGDGGQRGGGSPGIPAGIRC